MPSVTHVVDRQEVLMLIDLIEAPFVPVESKLKAIKRLEYITGMDIPGTRAFRKIRDMYIHREEETLQTDATMVKIGAEKPAKARTRPNQGVGKGGGRKHG